jgi:hypothetical protein
VSVMFKKYFADRKKRAKQLGPIVGVVLVAAIGTYLLVGSHAASPYTSIPADHGALSNGATSSNCTGATDGNCVTFGQPVAMDGNVALDFAQSGTPFASSSFWNTPVPSNVTLNPNSADYANEIANQVCYGYTTFSTAPVTCPSANNNTSALNTAEWSSPLYVVPADQPLVSVTNVCNTSTAFANSVAGGVPVPADAHGSGGAYVPDTPTVTPHGTAGTTTSYYLVASVTPSGTTTEPSSYGITNTGNATLSATNYNTITWTPVAGVTQYKIYRNYSSGTPSSDGLIATVSAENGNSGPQTFNDTGLSGTTAPTSSDTDEEITIYQPSTDKEWEFWQFRKNSSNAWTACWGGGMSNVSTSDGVFPSDLGATATSLPLLGGIPRVAEFRAGHIDHVMNLSLGENFYHTAIVPATTPVTYTVPANVTDPGNVAYSWPATRNDGGNSSTLAIPEGQRFILNPSLNLTQYNASLVSSGQAALTPLAMTIAVAAQKYGFVVVDSAGSVSIRMPDPTTYTVAGLPNPYTSGPGVGGVGNQGLYEGKASNLIMKNFPWGDLEALPFNYGKPSS